MDLSLLINKEGKIIFPDDTNSIYSYFQNMMKTLSTCSDYNISDENNDYYKLLSIFTNLTEEDSYSLVVFFLLMYNINIIKNDNGKKAFIYNLIAYLNENGFDILNVYSYLEIIFGTQKISSLLKLQNDLINKNIQTDGATYKNFVSFLNSENSNIEKAFYMKKTTSTDGDGNTVTYETLSIKKPDIDTFNDLNRDYLIIPKISYFNNNLPSNYREYKEKVLQCIKEFYSDNKVELEKFKSNKLFNTIFKISSIENSLQTNIFDYLPFTSDVFPNSLQYEFDVKSHVKNTIITKEMFIIEFNKYVEFINSKKESSFSDESNLYVDITDFDRSNSNSKGLVYLYDYFNELNETPWENYKGILFCYIMNKYFYENIDLENRRMNETVESYIIESLKFKEIYLRLYNYINERLGDDLDTTFRIR